MNKEDIFNVLRPIVTSVTGVTEVILANPNAPAPTGVYASILPIMNISERGQAIIYHENKTDGTIDRTIKSQLIAECSINFYRGDAHNNAQLLKQADKIYSNWLSLYNNKIGWVRTSTVNNLNFLQSNNWESRSQISIFLSYESNLNVENINTIEKVKVIIDNKDSEILADFDVETT